MKLKIEDLVPQKAFIKLSTGKEIELAPWSLRVRFWALDKYGAEKLQDILQTQSLKEITEIVFFMLTQESKKLFSSFDDFCDHVVTTQDILSLTMALLQTIGISEPMVDELRKEMAKGPKPTAQKKKKR